MKRFATMAEATEKLKNENVLSAQLIQHGNMKVKFYSPKNIDTQTPHRQDELYVIASGNGEFFCDGQTFGFSAGDVLFAEAGIEHCFVNFTNDFATWVIFYGPDGGESTQ